VSRRPGSAQRWAFLALFLVCAMAAANLQRMVDPDLFWQARAGEDILRAGRVVLPDSWTYLFEGRPWVNQQWLSQILMAKAFDWGGYAGLQVLKGLLAGATVLLLAGALKKRAWEVRLLCAGLFIACNARYFLFRTHLFSFLCMAALLFLLERVPPGRRLLGLLPLFALWANLHALFGLGLAVLGLWTGVHWLQRERRWTFSALSEPLSVMPAAAATLVNPFGAGVWRTALETLGHAESFLVTEWWPVWKYPFLANAGFYGLVVLTVLLAVLYPRRLHWPSLVAGGFVVLLGVKSVRFTSDATLPLLPLVARLMEGAGDWAEARLGKLRETLSALASGALAAFAAASLSWLMARPVVTPRRTPRQDYPVAAVSYMRAHGLQGKIFNEFDWGGFLAWSMPASRTVIDGRTATLLFPWGTMTAWKETVDLKPGWRERLEKGSPDFVLLYSDDYLAAQLANDPAWRLLYRDPLATLYGRK
jgi:hypothetical protein